jgi:acetylornithine deacetylase/succinyl-diaminopimelate desuccinylase-like protein
MGKSRMLSRSVLLFAGLCGALQGVAAAAAASPAGSTPQQREARAIYQQLVEINTVTESGDTAAAADAMAARLLAAGLPAADVQVFKPAPRKGNLVARLRGSGASGRKPILLMAHTDVVAARGADWSTDPFKLVEQDGWFYGRGTSDDKFMAAAFVANFIRYRREDFRPDRDLILLLATDEEIGDSHVHGVQWLLRNQRALIDAEFALNEGGGVGLLNGKPVRNGLQTSEKVPVNVSLETRNNGGHSSLPARDNAIYRLAAALGRLAAFDFPVQLNQTTRLWFERAAAGEAPQVAADMRAVAAGKADAAALARLAANPALNAQLRTTCVATLLDGGHASNALPQTARATVNCRVLPGEPLDAVVATLARVVADPGVGVALANDYAFTPSPPSPLEPWLVAAIEKLTAQYWPGVPLLPIMSAGATDGRFLRNAGIPTYGHSGLAADAVDVRNHGRDERVAVSAFYRGVDYLYDLVKLLATERR